MSADSLDNQLNDSERRLLDCFQTLKDVLESNADELEPFEQRNALKALAALWQVANGLDQNPGQLYELGA
jgi:hypothetical protein